MNKINNPVPHMALSPSPAVSMGEGVLIMDASPVTALGIQRVLTASFGIVEPINAVQNLASIPSAVTRTLPALLIMDICGENELMLDGLRLLAHLHESHPSMKVIICTDFSDHRILELLVSSNASGILLKHEPVLALTQCVSAVMSGERQWVSPKAKRLLSKSAPSGTPLTARELDVLAYLFSGLSVSGIAKTLYRNVRTVSTHKRNAMTKLGFHNDSELFAQCTWMAKTGPAARL
jgi:two-component system capsular synthesis response regulator RcsB